MTVHCLEVGVRLQMVELITWVDGPNRSRGSWCRSSRVSAPQGFRHGYPSTWLRRVEHWRAPVGGGLPASPFRLRDGFTFPPWATFPSALPEIPYVGFSPVRLQAPGTSKFGVEPSRPSQPLMPDPGVPGPCGPCGPCGQFTPPFGTAYVAG